MKDNPYQTPESELAFESIDMPMAVGWKVFFFISLAFMILNVFSIVMLQNMEFSIGEFIDLVVTSIGLIGLLGLAFNIKIITKSLWVYFFYCYLLFKIAFCFLFPLLALKSSVFSIQFYGTTEELNLDHGIMIVLSVLSVLGSYVYAFKRPQIWNRT